MLLHNSSLNEDLYNGKARFRLWQACCLHEHEHVHFCSRTVLGLFANCSRTAREHSADTFARLFANEHVHSFPTDTFVAGKSVCEMFREQSVFVYVFVQAACLS